MFEDHSHITHTMKNQCDDNCLYKLYVILKKIQLFIKNVSSIHHNGTFHHKRKSIGGIIVSMFASSAVDRGFETRSGQTND